jgi:hypothetical protein
MDTKRMLSRLAVGAALLLVFVMTPAAEAQSPSGSVAFESGEASNMGATMWVGCSLLFKGKLYGCTISGLSTPATGGSGIVRVSGMVYDLKEMGAFAGTYKAVGDDIALGQGHLTVKNQNGVKMIVSAFGQMTELQVADTGIEVKLK